MGLCGLASHMLFDMSTALSGSDDINQFNAHYNYICATLPIRPGMMRQKFPDDYLYSPRSTLPRRPTDRLKPQLVTSEYHFRNLFFKSVPNKLKPRLRD